MCAKISLNTGVRTYEIDNGTSNGATLKVNFSDTNLYYRFFEMQKSLEEFEAEFKQKTAEIKDKLDENGLPINDEQKTEQGIKMIEIMHDSDVKIKNKLADVFGTDNDFDDIFAGVNVMSLDEKGNSIISNFLEMITPIITESLDAMKKSDDKAVKALVGNREQRRARNGK